MSPTSASSANSPGSLSELIQAYQRAYTGRDPTRAKILAWWRARLGPDREAFAVTDDELFAALKLLREDPARVYDGRDADGRPVYRSKGRPKAPATVNRYRSAVQALYSWAIRERLAPRGFENPAKRIRPERELNAAVRWLKPDERERLLAACKASRWPRLYALVLLALTTGARRSELLGLTWGRVDLERGVAYLERTKNDQARVLPLVPAVVEELGRFGPTERPDVRVFPGQGPAGLFHGRNFEAAWQTALRDAKVKDMRFHDLRHSCASYLAQHGASLLEIADVLGHKALAVTRRYSHLTVDSKARLVHKVLGDIR